MVSQDAVIPGLLARRCFEGTRNPEPSSWIPVCTGMTTKITQGFLGIKRTFWKVTEA